MSYRLELSASAVREAWASLNNGDPVERPPLSPRCHSLVMFEGFQGASCRELLSSRTAVWMMRWWKNSIGADSTFNTKLSEIFFQLLSNRKEYDRIETVFLLSMNLTDSSVWFIIKRKTVAIRTYSFRFGRNSRKIALRVRMSWHNLPLCCMAIRVWRNSTRNSSRNLSMIYPEEMPVCNVYDGPPSRFSR